MKKKHNIIFTILLIAFSLTLFSCAGGIPLDESNRVITEPEEKEEISVEELGKRYNKLLDELEMVRKVLKECLKEAEDRAVTARTKDNASRQPPPERPDRMSSEELLHALEGLECEDCTWQR